MTTLQKVSEMNPAQFNTDANATPTGADSTLTKSPKATMPKFPTLPKLGSAKPQEIVKEAMVKAAAEIQRLQNIVDDSQIEKRATAIAVSLLREGQISADDLLSKVAELKSKNLDVIEEAMKLGYAYNSSDMGTVDETTHTIDDNPFIAALLR